jgi:hypothetical protein
MSLPESIPSARTARLPEIIPATIFRIERNILPITAIQVARIIFSILKFKKLKSYYEFRAKLRNSCGK